MSENRPKREHFNMESDAVTDRLKAYMEKLKAENNEAIERMTSFIFDRSSSRISPEEKREIIRKRVIFVFTGAEFTLQNDPDAIPLTAEDCRRIADEAEKAGEEPDVNRMAFQRVHQFIYENLCEYCDNPEDGLEDMLEICFRQFMATRVWDYEKPQPPAPVTEDLETGYAPALHGRATDVIASMAGRPLTRNVINDTSSIESGGAKLVVSHLTGTLGVSTHQLLMKGITLFTDVNHTGEKSREVRELGVSFSLKDYAYLCGYDVYEHPTQTEEEEKAEKKRAKTEMDNARKKVKRDLEILFNSRISWIENIRGQKEEFLDVHPIGAKGITNGIIYMGFTPEMGDYLIQLPLTQYPDTLYSVDGHHASAYAMGLKMWEHYNIYNNQKNGTAQLIKVKTLLKESRLAETHESLGKNRLSWETRIKEPFEDAMEYLVQNGTLKDWRYSFSKGVEMTDEEATTFSGYEEWAETLIFFTLKNAPDHTARLEAIEEKRKAGTQKAKKKKADKKE